MIKHNQDGAANGLVISLVFAILLLIGTIGFAGWTYTQMVDHRDNTDQKITEAEQIAIQKESELKDKQFAETSKNPLKTYSGPAAYGSLHIEFPKTWSGYVDESGTGNAYVDGYFNPGVVPSTSSDKSVFALRTQVTGSPYATVVKGFSSQQKAGKLSVSAYALPKLPKVVGVKAVGQTSDGKNVTMVVLPLRSQTLKIWTEGSTSLADFNKYILPNFSFSP